MLQVKRGSSVQYFLSQKYLQEVLTKNFATPKMKFSIEDSFSNVTKSAISEDLVTFIEEILEKMETFIFGVVLTMTPNQQKELA